MVSKVAAILSANHQIQHEGGGAFGSGWADMTQRHALPQLNAMPAVPPAPVRAPGEQAVPTARQALDGVGRVGGVEAARPPIRSLYIHVPFCTHKCHYCDFYSFVDSRDQQAAFVDRLIDELRTLAPHAHDAAGGHATAPLRTIFVGGGTPSLLRVELWERLLRVLASEFDLSLMAPRAAPTVSTERGEFTVECNPETTTQELLGLLRSFGVNRVSIGAQSFQPRHLKTLERLHNPDNVERAVMRARHAGIERQSIDLIYAIPGQTLDEWASDLDRALALGTTHLSCYNLTYEPNTAMTKRLMQGEFEPLDEDIEAAMYELTVERLAAGARRGSGGGGQSSVNPGAGPVAEPIAGLAQYEVSNFAVRGDESLHNLAYWRQEQWLAAGPSASGHAFAGPTMRHGSWRWKNVPRLGDYLSSGSGASPVVDLESPDPTRLVRERIMMGLRVREGIDAAALLNDVEAIAPGSSEPLLRVVSRHADAGHMVDEQSDCTRRWRLSHTGMMLCDGLAGELMRAIK